MTRSTEIRQGIVRQVNIAVARGMRSRWVVTFLLNGQQMFFVSPVDVSLFAKNRPGVCKEGDDIIVSGNSSSFSIRNPLDIPNDAGFEAKAVRNVTTGESFGDNGNVGIYVGGLLLAIGAGVLFGLLSYLASGGVLKTPENLKVIYFIMSALPIGGFLIKKGISARSNWNAVKPLALTGHGT